MSSAMVFKMMQKWWRQGIQRPLGTPFAYEVSAGAIVFRVRQGRREYLLLKYRNGHWDFVKGHVDDGETHTETVKREAEEEAQLKHLSLKSGFCHRVWYFYAPRGEERVKRLASRHGIWIFKTVFFYVAEASETDRVRIPTGSHEHSECVWLPYEAAYEKTTHVQSKEIMRQAEKFLQKEREE